MFVELGKVKLAGGYFVSLFDYIDWIEQLSFLRPHYLTFS